MPDRPVCPSCQSQEVRKHGQYLGKQRWFCKKCGLAFMDGAYIQWPEAKITPRKFQKNQLSKLLNIAVYMRKAQMTYLLKPCAKNLAQKIRREEKFDELAKKYLLLHQITPKEAPIIENNPVCPPE